MASRELQAVITIAGQLLIALWVLRDVGANPDAYATVSAAATKLVWAIGYVIVFSIVVNILARIVLSIVRREEFKDERSDERDRAIARRAGNSAYYVLMVGVILVGVVMPFSEPAWKIINAALLSLVVAEAVRYILIILSYRRGWHG